MAETPWYRRNTSWSVIAAVLGSRVAAVAGFVSNRDSLSSVRVPGVEITLEQQRGIKTMAAQVAALEGELRTIRDSLL